MKILVYMSLLYAIASAVDDEYPLYHIQDAYAVEESDLLWSHPHQANIWELTFDTFMITVWPPKYCHAVEICQVSNVKYSDSKKFHADSEKCEDSVKYYPHKNKILIGKKEMFHAGSHIIFHKTKVSNEYTVKGIDKVPVTSADYLAQLKTAKGKTVQLEGNLLIMTNSRYCGARLLSSAKAPTFYAIPPVDKLPTTENKWFWDGTKTLNTPIAVSSGEKTMQVITVLNDREYVLKGDMIGKVKLRCNTFSPMDVSFTRKKKELSKHISSHSIKVVTKTTSVAKHIKRMKAFQMSVYNCEWAKLWVSSKDETMSDHRKMKPQDTIEFLFNDRVFIAPDSDEARPLALYPDEMEYIQIRVHVGEEGKGTVVEMSYLPHAGAYGYTEFFNMPKIGEHAFNLHLIRAPNCDISIINEVPFMDYSSTQPNYQNLWDFSACTFNYLIPK